VPLFLQEFLGQDAIDRIVFGKKDVEFPRRFFRECADDQGDVLMRGARLVHEQRQQLFYFGKMLHERTLQQEGGITIRS